MNLIIDRGNTLYKIAVFDNDTLIMEQSFQELTLSVLEKIFHTQRIEKTILCSVGGNVDKEIIEYLESKSIFRNMNDNLQLPISIAYKTPTTLGKDRIASVVGALEIVKGHSVIVIDAGSCICVDYADKDLVYQGGSISPGIKMKYRSLNTFTANLPLLDLAKEEIVVCGAETQECIHSGVINGSLYEIEGFIDYYLQKDNTAEVVLTGGDAELIAKRLNRKVILDKHIVLKGLNVILNANAN
jgi:type III pantothenate kinase